MVYPLIARGVAALAAKQTAKEVAKKTPGRSEKFMGMAEEVKPLRLSDEVMRAGERAAGPPSRAGMSAGTKAMLAGAAAGAGLGAASLRSRKEEEPAKVQETKQKIEEDRAPSTKAAAAKKSSTRLAFEREFAKNRAAGEKEFTFNGETYTTRYEGETAAQHRKKMENLVDSDNKQRAAAEKSMRMAREEKQTVREDEYAKGGMAKKKTGYAKGGMVKTMCGASMPPAQKRK